MICEIPGRGWCVPSGRVEPDEEAAQAAEREAFEEGGAEIENVRYLGCYRITGRGNTRWAEAFSARITRLVGIPGGSESTGRKLVEICELPEMYHFWDRLAEVVFRHAKEIAER